MNLSRSETDTEPQVSTAETKVGEGIHESIQRMVCKQNVAFFNAPMTSELDTVHMASLAFVSSGVQVSHLPSLPKLLV